MNKIGVNHKRHAKSKLKQFFMRVERRETIEVGKCLRTKRK